MGIQSYGGGMDHSLPEVRACSTPHKRGVERCACGGCAPRTERQLDKLERASDVALAMVENTREEARRQVVPGCPPSPAPGVAHDLYNGCGLSAMVTRLVRAVRHTVALEARIQAGWPGPGGGVRAARAEGRPAAGPAAPDADDDTHDDQDAGAREPSDRENLSGDLNERFDDEDIDSELDAKPAAETIVGVCKDVARMAGVTLTEAPPPAPPEPRGQMTSAPWPPKPPPVVDPSKGFVIEPAPPSVLPMLPGKSWPPKGLDPP
jgi:hypothetical protein